MNEFFVKVLLNRVISKKEVISPEVIKAYTYPYLDDGSSIRAFLRASESIRAKDNPEFLTKVKTPTLFLWGAKDKVVPVRLAPKAQRFVAGSELLIHENAGHHPMEDHPEWVVEVTENFLSRLKA
jgi:pimeloyl-ACP methyl ester carboxylesterase